MLLAGLTLLVITRSGAVSASGSCLTPSFHPAPVYSLGTSARYVAAGDFNGDGRPDIITANTDANSVSLLLNDGTGTLSSPRSFAVGTAPLAVTSGDFNGDGKPDIAAANFSSSNITVLFGDGAGNFNSQSNFQVGTSPRHIVAGDFNQDGRLDLAVANSFSDFISVLLGNGVGGFTQKNVSIKPMASRYLAVGDFNGDGKPDLAVAMGDRIEVLTGDGAGGFNRLSNACAFTLVDVLVARDFNGDGRTDLAAITRLNGQVTVLLSDGTGCFGPVKTYDGGPSNGGYHLNSVDAADFDGDGKVDLIVSSDSTFSSVLLGDGLGGFGQAKVAMTGGGTFSFLAVADFNGDAKSDVALINQDNVTNTACLFFGNGAGGFDLTFSIAPAFIALGDFNRDGRLDMATPMGDTSVAILLNKPGGFGPPTLFATPRGASEIAVADFNSDGKLDLAVADNGSFTFVSILMGDGAGGFGPPANYPVDTNPRAIGVGDFNGDGKLDVVTVHPQYDKVDLLLNNGTGSFGAAKTFSVSNISVNIGEIGIDDFNGDGKLDLAIPSYGIGILLGDGAGGFNQTTLAAPGFASQAIAVGDFNGDGALDLVSAEQNTKGIALLLGNGAGAFGQPNNFAITDRPHSLAVGDFNGDGLPDVASANSSSAINGAGSSSATVLLNNGSGGFTSASSYTVSFGPWRIAAADLDANGSIDLITTSTLGSLSLLLNTCVYTAPPPPNPIDNPRIFVRQHYLDFLNREPDTDGLNYWTGQITQCGSNQQCIHDRRIGVSAAFYIELEFQKTGSVIYRMYRASYGVSQSDSQLANISYQQFIQDRPLIDANQIQTSTQSFANTFVQRQQFKSVYPDTMTNTEFVNKLYDTAGLTPYASERQAQVTAMQGGKTRAQVLLDVIEIPEFKSREFNRGFVLMQYFGYLRRDVDTGGYDFWLDVLNRLPAPNNFRNMVCAFITSGEYQLRFGSSVTRRNSDCASN